MNWCGNNWVTMAGDIGHSACDEPYLSDMVVVPAALVWGLLGVRPTWDNLIVQPAPPPGWAEASAEVVWKGERHRVVVRGGTPTVTRVGDGK